MNVAVVNTGPGVIWPTATASSSEVWRIEGVNPTAHPRMNVAAEPDRPEVRVGGKSVCIGTVHARENVEFVRGL